MAELEYLDHFEPLPSRARDGHKGSYGTVLIVGGSRGMIGAPALAANGALRGGAGLVRLALPAAIQLAVAPLCPCATSIPLPCRDGNLGGECLEELLAQVEQVDVLAVGPGLGQGDDQAQVVRALLGQERPVVLDADGLNNLQRLGDWPALRRCPLIVTPHPGEFARLRGTSVGEVQDDRDTQAAAAAGEWRRPDGPPLIVVLKGAGTVVTDGQRAMVNDTGNPGMATGGTGDVLTGLIAAVWGQGLEAFDAACLGVYAHGLAGDYAADELGAVSLIATDLLDFLPDALRELHE